MLQNLTFSSPLKFGNAFLFKILFYGEKEELREILSFQTQCFGSSVVEGWSLDSGVMSSSLLLAQIYFFQIFSLIFPFFINASSNPGQNWDIQHTRAHPSDLLCHIQNIELSMPQRGGVAESGGTGSKINIYILLLSTKMEKMSISSKNVVKIQKYFYQGLFSSKRTQWDHSQVYRI